jgi:hypothetical protein
MGVVSVVLVVACFRQRNNGMKAHEIITDENGKQVRRYPSSVLMDAESGQFLRGPDNAPVRVNPSAMNKRRYELARQAAREAMDQAAAEADGIDWKQAGTGYGWQAIIKHTVKTYLKSSNIRGMGETLAKLGQATGYLNDDKDIEPQDVTRSLIADLAEIARAYNREAHNGQRENPTIDGTIQD